MLRFERFHILSIVSQPVVRAVSVGVCAALVALQAFILPRASAAALGSYACGSPLAPDPTTAAAEVQRSYTSWKATYVTTNGAGGNLRVQRTENSNDTVSEGIGYGMLVSAYLKDRATFDGLWRYAKTHLDGNGLMHWRIDAGNNVAGANAATDADQDMALALIVADTTWGGYRADATALLGRIMQFEVEPNTFVLKPGDVWGGSSVTNPSYFAPAFYNVFRTYTGDARWTSVADASYMVIANVNAKSGAGRTGLQPDWTAANGTPASGMSYNYTYDATRVPWRLAADAAWFCDGRAAAQLDKLNAFFAGVGVANIRDGYRLDGGTTGQWHNAAFVAPAASGAIMASNGSYRGAMWNETVRLTNGNYYNDSLRMLALLLMSGNMPQPLGGTAPTATSAPVKPTAAIPTATTVPAAPTAIPPTATAVPAAPAAGSIKAQYRVGNADPIDNQISSHLQLVNTSGAAVPLKEFTIRYWFTREGDQPINYWCDWAVVGCGNVTAKTLRLSALRPGADTVLEFGFTDGAGTLAAGAATGEIQTRIAKNDWSAFDENNDASFNRSQTNFADWSKVTVYRNGVLIWGQEP